MMTHSEFNLLRTQVDALCRRIRAHDKRLAKHYRLTQAIERDRTEVEGLVEVLRLGERNILDSTEGETINYRA